MVTSNKEKLIIFDTTLRDGEQAPGVTLTVVEKLEIAKQLSRLGVDVLEAGFPISSQGDFEAVERIATEVGPLMIGREAVGTPMTIAGLARAVHQDIQRCFDAVSKAPRHRIHIVLATSDIHLKYKLKITREECIARAVSAVSFAKSLTDDVEFSPEDAGRSDQDFLCEVLAAVIDAGATTVNVPDTVGYNMPAEYGAMFKYLIANTKPTKKAKEDVIWSAHCHNDLGLATANTLAAIMNGVRQVEVTINGMGERAGNTAMEEVVMAIHTHPSHFPVYHTIQTEHLCRISLMVSTLSGTVIQPNKAIVGSNAFSHESGIHQDGVLKNKLTYEIISPETVGANSSNMLILGKHSGRAAFRARLQEIGFGGIDEETFQATFDSFKNLADSKKRVTEQDLIILLSDRVASSTTMSKDSIHRPVFILKSCQVVSGDTFATATVQIEDTRTGRVGADAAISKSGPVEALFLAIQRLVGKTIRLVKFDVSAVGEGQDALARVSVQIVEVETSASDATTRVSERAVSGSGSDESSDEDMKNSTFTSKVATAITASAERPLYLGHGIGSDIIQTSAKAYVNAINWLVAGESRYRAVDAKDVSV
ncbi:hypothetical protein BGW38_003078 [Lunasporangiospora selenospora]|uniref:2-isopropylmalate synthase n=1 Tax=Lunasporangiospora selenospora TaxID=979761 RepID=A0A9P6KHZ7_9FUNG|nr:hypothetical protein BGW38_003078 [Lunasporangiospora selenospora]